MLGVELGSPNNQTVTLGAQPGSPGTQCPSLGKQPGSAGTHIPTRGAEPGSPNTQSATLGAESGSSFSQTSIAGTQAQAFQEIGQLGILYATLKEQVAKLAASKAERSELEKLHQLFAEGVPLDHDSPGQKNITSALSDLQSQLSSLQSPASDLQGETGKIMQLEHALGKLQVPGAEGKEDIRLLLQELKQELGEQQQKSQAALEQLVDKSADQLQAQLDELRVVVESLRQAEGHAAHPICSKDTGTQVEQLLQRYEKLQEQGDSVMCQQAAGKVARQQHEKSQKATKSTAGSQVSRSQFEASMEQLMEIRKKIQSQGMAQEQGLQQVQQQLREVMDSKVRADSSPLPNAGTFGPGRLRQPPSEGLPSRLSPGDHHVPRRGSTLRWSTCPQLDRPELAPVQRQLEHCNNTLKQLKDIVPQTGTADGAAGMKYPQAHSPYLSCDQPLAVTAPGPEPSAECRFLSKARSSGGLHITTYPLQQYPFLQPKPPSTLPPSQEVTARVGKDGCVSRGWRKRR
ncbi:glutamine-rich protein 2-like isoform X2 [Cuculus canorus]|uniref:glutamine-rich protein 2-like isoform X2 n=1 Tax=Cuculus canorus TaxID=55661 RepID=UPI0023AA4B1A|nr:glutamine-rich protein 2-like isoform X2 [Cuculus canorus]